MDLAATTLVASFLAVTGLALVHAFSVKLRFLDKIPRSRWLSFAGGVAVTLVFLEILPQLGEGQEVVTRAVGPALAFLKNHIYIVALLGLFTFYVVERVVRSSRQRRREAGQGDETSEGVFWMNISWFSVKNAIVGYLLLREERTLVDLLLFFVAIGLEFLLSDRGLHNDHKVNYDRIGRWVLVAALFLGWGVGYFTEVSGLVLAVLSAFLAGIIILTVLKEELPEERRSSIWAFALGVVLYSVLLLAL